mmetsp:Transcript_36162/g.78989  ORF Transcript_36162/g.78989 Transcript_36162/m.78989 type:complete len:142 (+) Transcript_36162:564-989(+)
MLTALAIAAPAATVPAAMRLATAPAAWTPFLASMLALAAPAAAVPATAPATAAVRAPRRPAVHTWPCVSATVPDIDGRWDKSSTSAHDLGSALPEERFLTMMLLDTPMMLLLMDRGLSSIFQDGPRKNESSAIVEEIPSEV